MALLLPHDDVATGRPITPLHGGHVGLLCTAGLLNGVFGEGENRHIARWRSVKHVTTFVEQDGDAQIIHHRERWANELYLVYVDDSGAAQGITNDSSDSTTFGIGSYDTVNKIFTLSKIHPVGVMIFGNADFMHYPWELLVKEYREYKKARSLPTVVSWSQDFIKFVRRFGSIRSR